MRNESNWTLSSVLILIGIILFLPILIPLALLHFIGRAIEGQVLRRQFRRAWPSRPILFVYSESPNWQAYIERNILPQIETKSVIVNWSRRSEWKNPKSLEVLAFEHWGGERSFNPMAIVFPRRGKVRVIRFFEAFRDYKHGNRAKLEACERDLFDKLAEVERAV